MNTEPLRDDEFEELRDYFGSHSAVARELGVSVIYWCRIRKRGVLPSTLLLNSTRLLLKYVRIERAEHDAA